MSGGGSAVAKRWRARLRRRDTQRLADLEDRFDEIERRATDLAAWIASLIETAGADAPTDYSGGVRGWTCSVDHRDTTPATDGSPTSPSPATPSRPPTAITSNCYGGSAASRWPESSGRLKPVELLIARNPDPDSTLPYLLRLPLAGGMVFRTAGTWPRTKALFCYPVSVDEWPADPDIVERTRLRSCVRRGAAIDVVLDRSRESRSQIVFTKARGRDVVFWQSPRTRKQARPNVRTPTARAAGIAELEIVVDSHEQYAYRFGGQQVRTVKRALPCGAPTRRGMAPTGSSPPPTPGPTPSTTPSPGSPLWPRHRDRPRPGTRGFLHPPPPKPSLGRATGLAVPIAASCLHRLHLRGG